MTPTGHARVVRTRQPGFNGGMEDGPTRLNRPAMRTAAVLSWMLGLGFGLPCVYGI